MNVLASECSSGCESGWTSYLEQSFLSGNLSHKSSGFCDERGKYKGKEEVVDEEEDLSMVSDASSGPPHLNVDNGYFNDDNHYQYTLPKGATLNKNGGTKRHRKKEHQRQREVHQELPSLLDDTASSPLIKNNFAHTNNHASVEESVLHYPQGFSATHFQGGPAFQHHFGFLQSSPTGNYLQQGHRLSDEYLLIPFLGYIF
ncbi:hypothetical protein PVK06_042331 [Gossypium arboreum]|uniref:Uncharacterized protein n=1 Tax=Gossypium arboreum TaxID=29729 RepID=A0ABR0MKW6_GOSAR|nr:hypothetical protein PVK06_042331 [Gossypium arboreum]